MKKPARIILPLLLFFSLTVSASDQTPSPLPFSPAVRAGSLIFVSGHIGIDPATGELAGTDIVSQTAQALKNIAVLLKKDYGTSLAQAVKTTVFLKNLDDYASMNAAYGAFFPGQKPARSTVEVSRLVRGALVEIDAIIDAPGVIPAKQ